VAGVIVISALVAMAGLLVFVAADFLGFQVRGSLTRLRLTYLRMGRRRFCAALVGMTVWPVVYFLLSQQTHWHTSGAYLSVFSDSFRLLREDTLASDALFVWIWISIPAFLALWHVPRKGPRRPLRRRDI
jgi:hypothetical protein